MRSFDRLSSRHLGVYSGCRSRKRLYAPMDILFARPVGTDAHPNDRLSFPHAAATPADTALLHQRKQTARLLWRFQLAEKLIEEHGIDDCYTRALQPFGKQLRSIAQLVDHPFHPVASKRF